jgi:hypothetical protein
MFYRPKNESAIGADHRLKAQLEERFRTALDFATLGAYELEGPPHAEAPRGPQTRVFLFAKVAPACPHSAVPSGSCNATGRRMRRARRGGAAQLPPQPCTWAEPTG